MPGKPSVWDVHVNGLLSNIASKWLVSDDQFVAGRVFPLVPVRKLSDYVVRYDRRDWFRVGDVQGWAYGTESPGTGYSTGRATYTCKRWGVHRDIPDQVRENADDPFQPDLDSTQQITQLLMLKRDELFASAAFTTGVWSSQYTGVAGASNYLAFQLRYWSDHTTPSDPVADVDAIKERMHLLTGFQPNTMVINKSVYHYLRRHPTIRNRVTQYSQTKPVLNAQDLATVFDLQRVIVAEAVGNFGPEQGQWVGRPLFGNHAWIGYVAPAPSLTTPSAGYTFAYVGGDQQGYNVVIERSRAPLDAKFDRITGSFTIDVRVVEPDLGVFIQDILAPGTALTEVVADVEITPITS